MFRFTIRDLLWLMVVVGVAAGWWAEHRFVSQRSLRRQFEWQADRWETWCDEIAYSSVIDRRQHDAAGRMVEMGPGVIPLIFERWPKRTEGDHALPMQPPWWVVLERLTGKKMVSNAEKMQGIPFLTDPEGIEMPGLEEERWRKWWEEDGKREFGITSGPRDDNADSEKSQPVESKGGTEI